MLEKVEMQDQIQAARLEILLFDRACKHGGAKRGLCVFHQPGTQFQARCIETGPTHQSNESAVAASQFERPRRRQAVFEHSSHPMHTALVQIVARPLRQAWQSVILGYVRLVVAAPIKIAGIVDYVESFRRRPVLEYEGLTVFATEVFRDRKSVV